MNSKADALRVAKSTVGAEPHRRNFWDTVGRQFRNPSGRNGRLMGHVMRVINRRPNRFAIAALKIEPADIVLELGFGPGHAVATLAQLARDGIVWGIDRSSEMLTQASQRNWKNVRRGQVHLRKGSFDVLPLPDASVDKILAVNVVYFWEDAVKVLNEVRRVLRPGGAIAIYATDKSAMRRWKFAGAETHRLFDGEDLAGMLRRGGFDAADIEIAPMRAGFGVPGLVATACMSDASTPMNQM